MERVNTTPPPVQRGVRRGVLPNPYRDTRKKIKFRANYPMRFCYRSIKISRCVNALARRTPEQCRLCRRDDIDMKRAWWRMWALLSGQIGFTSDAHSGTTFWIDLPLAADAPP